MKRLIFLILCTFIISASPSIAQSKRALLTYSYRFESNDSPVVLKSRAKRWIEEHRDGIEYYGCILHPSTPTSVSQDYFIYSRIKVPGGGVYSCRTCYALSFYLTSYGVNVVMEDITCKKADSNFKSLFIWDLTESDEGRWKGPIAKVKKYISGELKKELQIEFNTLIPSIVDTLSDPLLPE